MSVTEIVPAAAPPPWPTLELSGDGDEPPYCFCCLVGTCQHRAPDGHLISAITDLQGTMLCEACARMLRNYPPARR